MAKHASRYSGESKLNVKKVIAVIVFILVIAMFVVGIKYLLSSHSNTTSGKVEVVTYYTAYDNGKWGVINSYGETVIKANYDEMIVIPDNTKEVFICTYDVDYTNGTYKTKAINAKGKEIISGYQTIETIANHDKNQNIWYELNVLKVQKNGKYGLIDFSGKKILACEYDKIEPIKGIENSLIIEKDGSVGLCNDSGNIIINLEYKKIDKIEDNYRNGYIVVDINNKYGIIGIDKKFILECKYEEVKGIYGGNNLFVVKENGKYEIINKDGEVKLQNKFDDAEGINGDYIIAKKNGKIGIIDIHGDTKVNFEYDEIKASGTNNYIAKKANKYGVISINREEKLAFDYTDISYVAVGDFYIVDYLEDGKLVSKILDSNYEEKITGIVSEVNTAKGYIRVYTNEEYKYYNFKFEEKPSSSFLTGNTLFLSKKNAKYGFVDKDGKVVVDYIYDDATEQNASGYAAVKKNGLWGSIDSKGNVVADPRYNLDNNTKIDFIVSWHLCEDKNANYYLDV